MSDISFEICRKLGLTSRLLRPSWWPARTSLMDMTQNTVKCGGASACSESLPGSHLAQALFRSKLFVTHSPACGGPKRSLGVLYSSSGTSNLMAPSWTLLPRVPIPEVPAELALLQELRYLWLRPESSPFTISLVIYEVFQGRRTAEIGYYVPGVIALASCRCVIH